MIKKGGKSTLQRLHTMAELLNIAHRAKNVEQEYCTWIKEHSILDRDFDFDQWLDSMPSHLLPCFQDEVKQMFPFLR